VADKGIVATEPTLAVVQQAGKLEQWPTSFADTLTVVISAQGEQDNDQLVDDSSKPQAMQDSSEKHFSVELHSTLSHFCIEA
jgi:hypothetical protein